MDSIMTKQKQFHLDEVIFSSAFESGNLSQVIRKEPNIFHLWIQADPKSTYKTWFFFSIQGIPLGTTITFCILNMSNQVKLFKEGHLPVFKTENQKIWARTKIPIQQNGISKAEDGFQLIFKHQFLTNSKHYFAFSYPWTCFENDNFIKSLLTEHDEQLFTNYQKLCSSTNGRNVNLLTVTKIIQEKSYINLEINQLKDFQTFAFKNKKVRHFFIKGIFISARVHPGEVASSHILNGFLKFLFSNCFDSNTLLQNFVFYIIPIINPDGVAEGNFRTDSLGKNLNRFYLNPSLKDQPEIYSIKTFLKKMIHQKIIHFCLDLHAHVNKQGAFIYGNSTPNLKDQTNVCLFPKILQNNCEFFDYDACNFSQKNMSSKDKSDELSKEGASRVAIYKETGLISCWTLECNYNSAKYTNVLAKAIQIQPYKSITNGILMQKVSPQKVEEVKFLNINQFEAIGKSIGQSILDYYELRRSCRIFNTKLKTMGNLKINLAINALRMIPFRFNNETRKLLNSLNSNNDVAEIIMKLKIIMDDKYPFGKEVHLFGKEVQIMKPLKSQNQIMQKKQSNPPNSSKSIHDKQILKNGVYSQKKIILNHSKGKNYHSNSTKTQENSIKPKINSVVKNIPIIPRKK